MHLNVIAMVRSDLERSLTFYRTLGVQLPEYDAATGHYEAHLGGGVRLLLDSEAVMASFIDGYATPTGNDRVSLAVECEAPTEVDAMYSTIVGKGFSGVTEPFDAFWGQ